MLAPWQLTVDLSCIWLGPNWKKTEEIRTLDPNLGKLTQPGAQKQKSPVLRPGSFGTTGAGEEIRTLDPNLGKVVLYH